jgi:hypothetical protein
MSLGKRSHFEASLLRVDIDTRTAAAGFDPFRTTMYADLTTICRVFPRFSRCLPS